MVGKIEPRYGAEVYISDTGKVCIKQEDGMGEEAVLIFEVNELDPLIALLKEAKTEHAEYLRVLQENENN